jgi:NAD(P) transhydrogenase subunit beta
MTRCSRWDINAEFGQADVAIILGANDVVNPAAHVKGSAIYGMPILEAYKAKTVIVNKRSMAAVMPAWTMNSSTDKTMMVFGDAKNSHRGQGKAIEWLTRACATVHAHGGGTCSRKDRLL